jgi:hypothetical protein
MEQQISDNFAALLALLEKTGDTSEEAAIAKIVVALASVALIDLHRIAGALERLAARGA